MLQDDKVITIDQFHQVVNDVAAETIGYNVTQRSVKTECRRYMTGILPIRRKTQYNQSIKTERLSKDTWSIIEERKKLKKNTKILDAKSPRLKEKTVALYWEKDKEAKKSARKDRRYNIEQLAEDTHATAERNDMKTDHKETKG